jgi:hypothetical protein
MIGLGSAVIAFSTRFITLLIAVAVFVIPRVLARSSMSESGSIDFSADSNDDRSV